MRNMFKFNDVISPLEMCLLTSMPWTPTPCTALVSNTSKSIYHQSPETPQQCKSVNNDKHILKPVYSLI